MRLLSAVLALTAVQAAAQMRLDLSLPSNRVVVKSFEDFWKQPAGERGPELECTITTVPASLGFDLRLWAGYYFTVPLAEFKGLRQTRLSAIIRIERLDATGEPVYLGRRLAVPSIPSEPSKRLHVGAGGGFAVGEGRYRASLLIVDVRGRWCAKSWKLKANTPRGGAPHPGKGEVQDASGGWPGFASPAAGVQGRRATVLVNAFPVTRRRNLAALSWRDQSTLLNVLASLLSRGGFHSARVLAVDVLNRQVVYDEPRFSPGSFESLGDALGAVNLATVDYGTLAEGPGEHQFLESIVKRISKEADPGEIVFITPSTQSPGRPGARNEGVWEGLRRPAVLALLPRPIAEGSVVEVAKGGKGRIFSIYTPADLASAVERIASGRP